MELGLIHARSGSTLFAEFVDTKKAADPLGVCRCAADTIIYSGNLNWLRTSAMLRLLALG